MTESEKDDGDGGDNGGGHASSPIFALHKVGANQYKIFRKLSTDAISPEEMISFDEVFSDSRNNVLGDLVIYLDFNCRIEYSNGMYSFFMNGRSPKRCKSLGEAMGAWGIILRELAEFVAEMAGEAAEWVEMHEAQHAVQPSHKP